MQAIADGRSARSVLGGKLNRGRRTDGIDAAVRIEFVHLLANQVESPGNKWHFPIDGSRKTSIVAGLLVESFFKLRSANNYGLHADQSQV